MDVDNAEAKDSTLKWEQVQIKTFTNWANMHLQRRGKRIDSVVTDFKDGTALLYLLSAISEEPVPKHVAHPKMKVQCIENINTALGFIERHGVKLADVGATEIYDQNVKMTLGMVWCLILRFVVSGLSEEGLSAKEGLLLWCKRKTKNYNNVHINDFSGSFQDGLAFCALVHCHRPDLIQYDSLSHENKIDNLNLAFDVCNTHLGISHLLDAEDIVSMPHPDERSIMTYVAELYKVFSSMDQMETAGRRICNYVDFVKEISDFVHDYEERTRALLGLVSAKTEELKEDHVFDEYGAVKGVIDDLRNYRKTTRRQWLHEQGDLSALFTQIQAKLSCVNQDPYVPPEGLHPRDVEEIMDQLNKTERARRSALNANLREILDKLRHTFADRANSFYESILGYRSILSESSSNLEEQLASIKSNEAQLVALGERLPDIEKAEKECDAAKIEDNEYTDHTYEDLEFEYDQSKNAFTKTIAALESQIASKVQKGVTAEQLEEYKNNFNHFDDDNDGILNRLEFKSLLSGLGLVAIDFDGSDKKADELFLKVSERNNKGVNFDQFVSYMVSITADATSSGALKDSFNTLTNGRSYVTRSELKAAGMSEDQINYLAGRLHPGPVEDSYEIEEWLNQPKLY
ncbi:uncharacterized protein LOC126317097 [Schistocerca gregaria]|uniref:uncharacterized protein LOC126317097 n=1 Tax=Schistocerca gregaria TaxID=7010 RepID=UPI00211DF7C2|nr:uncharacterized protein LOC126317097 [Schistocerca gregaria]